MTDISLNSISIACIDAFTTQPYFGNPAAVCLLPHEADETWMQSVATEMNLSETAFLIKRAENRYSLRWFTPTQEVDLCGHATLASAHFLREQGVVNRDQKITFEAVKHTLEATFIDDRICLDFPLVTTKSCVGSQPLLEALGLSSRPLFKGGDDFLVEVESRKILRQLTPDTAALKEIKMRGVIVTAEGDFETNDFLSRFFAPGAGINEDPVTGSAHCALAHFWAARLGKTKMEAEQLSARGGKMTVEIIGDRVKLTGSAITTWHGVLAAPVGYEKLSR